jgi:23S rRNA pseudouridine1911/1915/1917 synthase
MSNFSPLEIPEMIELPVELPTENPTARLDSWLASQLSDLSRSRLQKLIEQGQVKVNTQICLEKQRLIKNGDRLVVTIPLVQPLEVKAEAMPLDILYEDSSLIIINKPAGLVVHKPHIKSIDF